MTVTKISGADVYRDGGSYGFWFDSDDGCWYEFFLEVTHSVERDAPRTYHEPRIYLEGVNSKNVVQSLSWEAAKEFIAPLRFESPRFYELVAIVNNDGHMLPTTS